MTGSRAQLYNGIALLVMFFCCRLVWGTYQSLLVYQDVWHAIQTNETPLVLSSAIPPATNPSLDEHAEVMRFAKERTVPVWLAVTYLGSNVVLNTLNFYWFGKMIETVRKRFREPAEDARPDGVLKADERVKAEFDPSGETVTIVKTEVRRRHVAQKSEEFTASI